MKLVIDDTVLPVRLVRTDRRKTVSISLEDGAIRVLAPKRLSERRIQEIIDNKSNWIGKRLKDQATAPKIESKKFMDGETFSYLGKHYIFEIRRDIESSVKLKSGRLISTLGLTVSKREELDAHRVQVTNWYHERATDVLTQKTAQYGRALKLTPSAIRIKNYKARWGSCAISGEISYNWKIMMAPSRIIDYVVIHELSHLVHHDHSDKFWRQVDKSFPEYRECRTWLRNFGQTLMF
jgi:predicted metal-dependent hydrolase